jgi:hypothetical protein
VAHPQGGRPAVVIYPFGNRASYAYDEKPRLWFAEDFCFAVPHWLGVFSIMAFSTFINSMQFEIKKNFLKTFRGREFGIALTKKTRTGNRYRREAIST